MTPSELRALCERVIELHRNGSPTADLWKYSESQHEDHVTGYVKRFKHLYYRYSDHLAVEGDEQAGRDFQLIAEYRKSAPDLARSCLSLLVENAAMRGVVDAARNLDCMTTYRADNETDSGIARERLRAALAKLGERT